MSGNREYETASESINRHFEAFGVSRITAFIVFASIIGIVVVHEATESDYAAGFIVLLAGVIAFAFGVRTRAGFLDYNEKELEEAYQDAEDWKKEAETIWSHISDESPVKRGTISNTMAAQIAERDSYICAYCGVRGTEQRDPDGRAWHIDHIQPVSRGGLTVPANLTLACSSCNLGKGALTAAEYMRRKFSTNRRIHRNRTTQQ